VLVKKYGVYKSVQYEKRNKSNLTVVQHNFKNTIGIIVRDLRFSWY